MTDDLMASMRYGWGPEVQGAMSGAIYRIERDGFEGVQIGSYVTLEGHEGIVLQQLGTKVVHVYRRKWAVEILPPRREDQ